MFSPRLRRLAVSLTALAVLAGCSAGGSGGDAADPTTAPEATTTTTEVPARLAKADEAGSWTVFVYLAADNNLEGQALGDIAEMAQTEGTQFVVLLDRAAGYAEDELGSLGNFEDSVVLDGVQIGRNCRVRRAIIDKNVVVPEGASIGFDREADLARGFSVTDSGITVVGKGQEVVA